MNETILNLTPTFEPLHHNNNVGKVENVSRSVNRRDVLGMCKFCVIAPKWASMQEQDLRALLLMN